MRLGISPLAVLAPALAARTDPEADRAAVAALRRLLTINPAARTLDQKAIAVLMFPKIVKAGFLFGGAYDEGALLRGVASEDVVEIWSP